MKSQLLSLLNRFVNTDTEKSTSRVTKIFLTDTHASSGRTLMIEEEAYAVWAYLLSPDKEEVDFDGFLCSVVDPKSSKTKGILYDAKGIKDKPLPSFYANQYCYVKNLKKKNIKVLWGQKTVTILIKEKVYLVMDLMTKTSYSKGLIRDCEYGKQLKM
ncbi:hypothetical protein [Aquimarina sp. I32.4]|uniref:hypothetical protein n=1 Tax=Aquimarina sp. I32.4 TaxID=2053903 RepID=UPI000CDEDEAC|nr:hypothetical protein [Aquimarina sp. I32.4]